MDTPIITATAPCGVIDGECGDDIIVASHATPLGHVQRETLDGGDAIWIAYVDGEGQIGEHDSADDAVKDIALYCAPADAPKPIIAMVCDISFLLD